jgi:hypothetical protein
MIDFLFDNLIAIIVVAILALVVACPIGYVVALRSSHETVTFTVKDKLYHSGSGNSSGSYLIYTDKGVFADEDSMTYFKFNSSDIYAQLQRGHTYTCSAAGWRVPFLSSYVNLMSCKEAK